MACQITAFGKLDWLTISVSEVASLVSLGFCVCIIYINIISHVGVRDICLCKHGVTSKL